MKHIKSYLTAISVAGIYIYATFHKQLWSSQCTGACQVCGGTCLVSILAFQVIGLLVLAKGKIIRLFTMEKSNT